MNLKPIYRLSVATAPDEPDFLADATAKLEAAGYVVVLTNGPSEIHAPPVGPDARTLVAAMMFGHCQDIGLQDRFDAAVRRADLLLKELAK